MSTGFLTLCQALGKESRPNRTAFLEEEMLPEAEQRYSEVDAEIVEPGRSLGEAISGYPASRSLFRMFTDGIENCATVAWYKGLPIRMAQVAAAAVLRNEDGDMEEVVAEERKTAVLFPNTIEAEVQTNLGAFCGDNGCTPVSVPPRAEVQDWHMVLREDERKIRGALEESVQRAAAARASEDCWILADGRCPKPNAAPTKFVVGLVKSHRHPYFRDENFQAWVLTLPEGSRTPVFCAAREDEDARITYSWYLRLHESNVGPPWFGLIRLEMNDLEMAIRYVDQITAWVLAERAPLSLPDSRYDRLIYPIRYVEQYLRSRLRSRWDLKSLIE